MPSRVSSWTAVPRRAATACTSASDRRFEQGSGLRAQGSGAGSSVRIVTRFARVLVIVLTLVVGATSAAAIVSQTAWFRDWLRGFIVREANTYLNGTLSIERLGGNLFFGIEMKNIGLSMDGSQVVAVKDLGIDYNLFALVTRGLSVNNIRLNQPVVYLRREGDTWSLSRIIKKQEQEADRKGPEKPITIDEIRITGGSAVFLSPVEVQGVDVPRRFDHLDAKLSFKYEPVRYSIAIAHLSFRGSEPALALNELSGGIAVKDDTVFVEKLALRTSETSLSADGAVQHYLTKPVFNLQVSSEKLSIPEIALVVPSLAGIALQPSFNVKSDGPLDHLGLELNVQSPAGAVSGKVVADLLAPGQSVQGELSVRNLDLSALLNDPARKSDITANVRADLHGEALSNVDALHGTLSIDSPRLAAAGYVAERVHANARVNGRQIGIDWNAAAYGAAATFAGDVTLPDAARAGAAVAYDVHGQATHVDLGQLPPALKVPPAATDVNADYHARGEGAVVTADVRFQPSTVACTRIAAGSTAGVTIDGAAIAYRADATVADLDLERIGKAFRVTALAVDQYKSSVNGHIVAHGSGTDPATLDAAANGTLTSSSILGGTIPQLDFDVALAADTARVRATGSFAGF